MDVRNTPAHNVRYGTTWYQKYRRQVLVRDVEGVKGTASQEARGRIRVYIESVEPLSNVLHLSVKAG